MHTVYYGTGDNTSPRWRKTTTNGFGQVLTEESPGPNGQPILVEHDYDDETGQRIKTSRTGMADTYYEYDPLDRVVRQGLDLNNDDALTVESIDDISESSLFYEKDGSDDWWEVSVRRRYLTDNDDEDVSETITRRKLGTGSGSEAQSTGADGIVTTSVTTVDRSNKKVTATTTSELSNIKTS